MAAEGLVTVKSAFGPEETMQRLEAEVKAKGMTVFAHVDHAAGAAAVDEVFSSSQVTGAVGYEESDQVSDVGGVSGSAEGDATDGLDDLCARSIGADL